jgi:hypothetical protein
MKLFIILSFTLVNISFSLAQQVAIDTLLVPQLIAKFKNNNGPTVAIDTLHNNFHTANGRFLPFATLLKRDGFQFKTLSTLDDLKTVEVYVISNPINSKNIGNWQQPIYNAFSNQNIETLKEWVEQGGRLLLIADHMPFAGAANNLANAFGFDFCDGFAQLDKQQDQPDVFSITNNRLQSHAIVNGELGDRIDAVTTFTGSSFTIPEKAQGVLKFIKTDECLSPERAWEFDENTPTRTLENAYQGAVLNYGKGKVAIFGEAAMFTSQTITNNTNSFNVGFTSTNAPNNVAFIRNVMYWLTQNKK